MPRAHAAADSFPNASILSDTLVVKSQKLGLCPVRDVNTDPSLRELTSIVVNVRVKDALLMVCDVCSLHIDIIHEKTLVQNAREALRTAPGVPQLHKAVAIAELGCANHALGCVGRHPPDAGCRGVVHGRSQAGVDTGMRVFVAQGGG